MKKLGAVREGVHARRPHHLDRPCPRHRAVLDPQGRMACLTRTRHPRESGDLVNNITRSRGGAEKSKGADSPRLRANKFYGSR